MKITPAALRYYITALLVIGLGIYFSSVRSLDAEGIIRKAVQKEKKINSYYTMLETEINLGKAKQHYYVEVWFLSPDCHRVEISSSSPEEGINPEQVFLSDGEKTWIYNPEIEDFYEIDNLIQGLSSPPFLLVTFLQSLSQAQEAELIALEKMERGSYYLLRVVPSSPAQKHAWEQVWFEKKSFLPARIDIYDINDQLQQTIIFHKTVLNLKIDEEIFKN
ncbi:MAG: outer-membrane lipoprotein carrier protein LolA [Bacillota bacterium]|nr:outer-membrane lipoprotein carrier protein LolA [Bacillota bacterium]